MKKIIVGIGMSGSGKTTLLKDFATRNSYTYISPDVIRSEVTGNVSDQSSNQEVWKLAYERVEEALKKGVTVVFDSTLYRQGERRDFIEYARSKGASKIEGIYFVAPYAVALERNAHRGKEIPEHALLRMHENLTLYEPSILDGFDTLLVLDTNRGFEETKNELEKFFPEPEPKQRLH